MHKKNLMEKLKEFFEVTSIHGLYHVSKNRSLRRLFWTATTTVGFLLSFSMIYENFENFSKTPVSTTIETWPISKVPFPPITICPVKNTLTNLNYDLINSKSYNLSTDDRNYFIDLFYESFQEVDYKITIEFMKEMIQSDWLMDIYKKLGMIAFPDKHQLVGDEATQYIYMDTFNTSGKVRTPFFKKEVFEPEDFKSSLGFKLKINVPKSLQKSNATIDIDIIYDIEVGPENIRIEYNEIELGNKTYNTTLNVTECYIYCLIDFNRYFTKEGLEEWKNRRFTGMKVIWNMKMENVRPKEEEKFDKSLLNNVFCKMVNMIKKEQNNEKIWRIIKSNKRSISDAFLFLDLKQEMIFDMVFPMHGNISNEPINLRIIKEKDLKTALEMLTYLFNEPQEIWKDWKIFYERLFKKGSERLIVSTLSGILSAGYDEHSKEVARTILDRVREVVKKC